MSTINLDPNFADHRKILPLTNAAFRVHVVALCWCSRHETDGLFSLADALLFGASLGTTVSPGEYIRELLDARLWERWGPGYRIHHWLKYNRPAEQLRSERSSSELRERWIAVLGNAIGVSASEAPSHWHDLHGRRHRTSRARAWQSVRADHRALIREFVFSRDGKVCAGCERTSDLLVDHILAQRNGGAHHPNNMQVLCLSCNSRKSGLIDKRVG